MARTRTAGGGPSVWALVIFGMGFGICLVLTILFYVQLQGAEQRAEENEDQLRRFVTAAQENHPEIVRRLDAEREQRVTVVQQMLDSHNAMRRLLTGDEDADVETINEQVDALNVDRPLLTGIESLVGELNDRSRRIDQLQENLNEARQRAEELDQRLAQLAGGYDEAVRDLDGRLQTATRSWGDYTSRVDGLEQDLIQRVQQVHDHRADELRALESERDELNREVDRLRGQLAEARRRNRGIEAPEFVRADGRIASIGDNPDLVHINLGREHNIVRGMRFEVFTAGRPIEPEPDNSDSVRGKATIRVEVIGPTSSQARVIRRQTSRQDREIAVDDQIVNVAYSPDTVYSFYVHGRFDIERTGEPSTRDRERIMSNVRRWGGRVADELTYEVDFLVLGIEPTLPETEPDVTDEPVAYREYVDRRARYQRHQEVIARAREHGVPILSQNRFLDLIGYFDR